MLDPVHGNIAIPDWLKTIGDEPIIRRMIDIRQLGLKAYLDLPGAIHTRYLHSLGTMHLARQLIEILGADSEIPGDVRSNLSYNKDAIGFAAFIHDVGHGPYSHLMDYPMKSRLNKTHEEISIEVVEKYSDKLTARNITPEQVKKIIQGDTDFPYIHEVINGPIDVDKFDYMLRDSYHAGMRYGFDLRFLLNQLTLVGKGNPENFHLGLKSTTEAIAYAEMFLLNWRTLYTVLYYAQRARIAEMMLEKAILKAIDSDDEFKNNLLTLEAYSKLDEAGLRMKLETIEGLPKQMIQMVWANNLYSTNIGAEELRWSFDAETFKTNELFLDQANRDAHKLADDLSIKLSEMVGDEYSVICDILKSRIPRTIFVRSSNTPEGYEILLKKSPVIQAISRQTMTLAIYLKDPDNIPTKLNNRNKLKNAIEEVAMEWS